MSKTINRIIQLLEELNLSARQFDLSIGSSNGYTLRMQKNNASVGSDVIERIVKTYPQVNLIWLITGKGDMFISKVVPKPVRSKAEIEAYINDRIWNKNSIEEKQYVLDSLLKEIEDLKKSLEHKP